MGARRPVIKRPRAARNVVNQRLVWRIARADKFDFAIVLEPQIERGFTVSVPPLPEVVAEGDTEIEAMA